MKQGSYEKKEAKPISPRANLQASSVVLTSRILHHEIQGLVNNWSMHHRIEDIGQDNSALGGGDEFEIHVKIPDLYPLCEEAFRRWRGFGMIR